MICFRVLSRSFAHPRSTALNRCYRSGLRSSGDRLTRQIDLPVVGGKWVRRVNRRTEAMPTDEPFIEGRLIKRSDIETLAGEVANEVRPVYPLVIFLPSQS